MTRPKFLPALFPALVAAALSAHALPARGASVKQVRVGDHADYTRIVVELDGPAGYSVEQKTVAGVAELVVGLEATTSTRVVSSRSRLVENVRLRPSPQGAEARIALRAGAVNVKEMVLKNPHRIVLDLSPAKAPAATATPARVTTAAPAPTRTVAAPKPKPAATAVEAAPTAAATRVEAAPTAASAPSAKPSKQAGTRPLPQASPAPTRPEAQAEPGVPAERSRAVASRDAVSAGDAEASAGEKARVAAATEARTGAAREKQPEARTGAAREKQPEARTGAAREKQPEARTGAAREKQPESEPAAAAGPSLIERLGAGDPGLGLTIALGGVAFLVAAFLLLRRRSQRIAREAATVPWPPPGAEERPEAALHRSGRDEEGDPEREPRAPMDETDAPLFAATEREEEGDAPVVELPEAPSGAEPEVVAKTESPEVEELERRIERLEARLADSLDARERLERQLAAHTEELRVQRAAIARTQRAVRAAVRNPDAPEPPAAQRVPSQMPDPASGPQPGEGES